MSTAKVTPGERPEVTDKTGRTPQVFIRDESGEPACYCGPANDREAVRIAMSHVLASMLDGALMEGEDDEDFCLEIWWMTPEEVAEIPAL